MLILTLFVEFKESELNSFAKKIAYYNIKLHVLPFYAMEILSAISGIPSL